MGGPALAIKRVIGKLAANKALGVARDATLVHRSGSFDTATLETNTAPLKESVRLFEDKIATHEFSSGAVEKGTRRYMLPSQGLREPPTMNDALQIGTDQGRPVVWEITDLEEINMGGTTIAYMVDVKR